MSVFPVEVPLRHHNRITLSIATKMRIVILWYSRVRLRLFHKLRSGGGELWYRLGLRKVPAPALEPCCCCVCGSCPLVAVLDGWLAVPPVSPSRVLSSSLQVGWPPLLEESTSETPLSAGEGGREPGMKGQKRRRSPIKVICQSKCILQILPRNEGAGKFK